MDKQKQTENVAEAIMTLDLISGLGRVIEPLNTFLTGFLILCHNALKDETLSESALLEYVARKYGTEGAKRATVFLNGINSLSAMMADEGGKRDD